MRNERFAVAEKGGNVIIGILTLCGCGVQQQTAWQQIADPHMANTAAMKPKMASNACMAMTIRYLPCITQCVTELRRIVLQIYSAENIMYATLFAKRCYLVLYSDEGIIIMSHTAQ